MSRKTLDQEINKLFEELILTNSMVQDAGKQAMIALVNRDLDISQAIYSGDQIINQKRFLIENKCISLIATQNPLASDLRLLASIIEVSAELERMGDYIKGIAKISLLLGDQPIEHTMVILPQMSDIALSMLHQAISAFVNRDSKAALSIPKDDDQIDALYNLLYNELVTLMTTEPGTAGIANDLLWIAHNIERLGDRVTNICERTIYVDTGETVEINPSDDELKYRSDLSQNADTNN